MPANTIVYDVAAEVLAEVVSGFTAAGVTLPPRRIVHAGLVAYDCEQVAVEVNSLFHGFPGNIQPAGRCEVPRAGSLNVIIVRCVPTPSDSGQEPSVTQLNDSARQILTDGWHLADVLYRANRSGALFITPGCSLAEIGTVEFPEPSGGFGAAILTLEIQI